ncbi:MAG: hypothetical protein FJ271_13980 [Planctomycetes bacterium]|nr:hypothetical protein [Planctomycetota bacterium]
MRTFMLLMFFSACGFCLGGEDGRPSIHVWFEPEWFEGVKGSFGYWSGPPKATGSWGIAGPGISAEWSQGGESEWNSMGAAAEETKARCHRDFIVPRTGEYTIWVRYVDHRHKTEPFRVLVEQSGKNVINGERGVKPVVPANDEYQLFWGFSFGWGSVRGKLEKGPARLILAIDRPGQAWRQLDAVLITDDAKFMPHGREKPAFAYQTAMRLQPEDGANWRGNGKGIKSAWVRPKVAGRDFSMWTGIDTDLKWWAKQNVDGLKLYDIYFQFSPPADIRDKFHKELAGKKDIPIMSWPGLLPGLYLGGTPDFSPGTPLRKWFERTKTPFYIMTNYASGNYDAKNGPATYAALAGPLADQFLGFIHGEAVGTGGVSLPHTALGKTRREHVDAVAKSIRKQQAESWSKIFKTQVPDSWITKSISCLSVDSIALAHLFHDMGCKIVGYEEDATNVHVPMRIAFERGAARQYGGSWINYASGNFGDACNYFTQKPVVERGAPSWFHSKYAVTDGVSICWYRKLYYINYLSGAAAIYWEQSLGNQWMIPGPGTHPVQLSPFGRATEDFQAFVSRLPDRGEPCTPIGVLLSYGHAYERVNNYCKMLNVFTEDKNDLELRELFNVLWHPVEVLEGQPASPDVQSMPSGTYGNIFDMLVDRPERSGAIFNYPIIWAAGDTKLDGKWHGAIDDYVRRGGTLVINVAAAGPMPDKLLGAKVTGKKIIAETWMTEDGKQQAATPFEVADVNLDKARALAWAVVGDKKTPLITRHAVGAGAVIMTLVPHLVGHDERAHPSLPYLMNGLTKDLLPVEVRLADGSRPKGEIMYQVNKTKRGYLVALFNQRGIDKTQNGIARVDRRQFVDVVVRTRLPVAAAKEQTEPRDLAITRDNNVAEVRVRVHTGDLQVVDLTAK